jgi:hypothetical protein
MSKHQKSIQMQKSIIENSDISTTNQADVRDIHVSFLVSKNIRKNWLIAAAENYSTMTTFVMTAVNEKIERDQIKRDQDAINE